MEKRDSTFSMPKFTPERINNIIDVVSDQRDEEGDCCVVDTPVISVVEAFLLQEIERLHKAILGERKEDGPKSNE